MVLVSVLLKLNRFHPVAVFPLNAGWVAISKIICLEVKYFQKSYHR